MKCPACGHSDAYHGFSDIDCPNNACRHFKGSVAVDTSPADDEDGDDTLFDPFDPWNNPQGQAPALTVTIIQTVRGTNNVRISFTASGDPGNPNKEVEFTFELANNPGQAQICTLSSPYVNYVAGVDADGTTIYTTNWLCTQDGVQPTDSFKLHAFIN